MTDIVLRVISSSSAALPFCIAGLFGFRIERKFAILIYIVILSLIVELLSYFLKNNLFLMNTYTVLNYVLCSILFGVLFTEKLMKRLVVYIAIFFTAYAVFNLIYIQGLYFMNSYTLMLNSVLMVLFSILLFFDMFRNKSTEWDVLRSPEFWIGSGFLIYFGGNFFTFAYSFEFLTWNSNIKFNIWNLHSVLRIVFNIILSLIVWLSRIRI